MADFNTGSQSLDYVLSLVTGNQKCVTMTVASKLEVFDEFSGGPLSAAALAEKKGWQEKNLASRLLNALVSLGLMKREQSDLYSLTPPGMLLVRKAANSVWGYAVQWDCLIAGVDDLMQVFTKSSSHGDHHPEQWHAHGEHHLGHDHGHGHEWSEEDNLNFYRASEGYLQPQMRQLITKFDLSGFKLVTDLGGGSGALCYELARTYPGMKLNLYEFPSVLTLVEKHFQKGNENLDVSLIAGDMMKDEIPTSDLFILCLVIHHLDAKHMEFMLKKIYNVTNPGGGIMCFEKLLNDQRDGPPEVAVMDFSLSSDGMSIYSGKDFKEVLKKQGYTNIQIVKTQALCFYDIIYARKP